MSEESWGEPDVSDDQLRMWSDPEPDPDWQEIADERWDRPVDNWMIDNGFEQVGYREFYRDLFPAGELETKGMSGKTGLYNALATQIRGKGTEQERARRWVVTDELDVIDYLAKTDDFCVMAPISYAGKSRSAKNARNLYALVLDLDEVRTTSDGHLSGMDLLWRWMTKLHGGPAWDLAVPVPTYIVSSGTGMHLYYLFERPIPLFPNVVEQLRRMRHFFIDMIWKRDITALHNKRQYESVTQAFRMVGSITKSGERVTAWRTGERVTIEYLNKHIRPHDTTPSSQVTHFAYKRRGLSLEEAKEKYPDWYERRVVQGQPRSTWTTHRGLYEWWKDTMYERASEGHRYFCMMVLAIYARKSGVPFDELKADALALIKRMNDVGESLFTEEDTLNAIRAYEDQYITFPRHIIQDLTAIPIPPNKRNGRPREQHVEIMNAIRDVLYPDESWRNTAGAPIKRELIRQYAREHPDANHSQIARALGVSRPTVIKWLRGD